MGAVGAEGAAVDILVVLSSDACCEFEGWTRIECQTRVIGTGGCSHGSLWLDRNTVDLSTLSRDLAHTVAAVPCDAVTEPLPAISYSNNTLIVSIPGNVVDASGDDLVFTLCGTFSYTVPDLDVTGGVSACDIEARRTEPRNGGVCGVADVLS